MKTALFVLAALVGGLFISFRLFYQEDFDEEKVFDLLLGGIAVGFLAWWGVFLSLGGIFAVWVAFLAYFIFALLFLYFSKWPFLLPLGFLAAGGVVALVILTVGRVVDWRSGVFLTAVLIFAMIFTGSMSASQKQILKQEEKKLKQGLDALSSQDPKNRPERVMENAPEEESDESETGNRVAAIKRVLAGKLKAVKQSLQDLRRGNYGICDKCGQKIDSARQKAVPDAQYCLKCEKELEEQQVAAQMPS